MLAPDDFGLTWQQTLSRCAASARCEMHGAFWQAWVRAVSDHRATLETVRSSDDPSDPTVTHAFEGMGHTSIGCRLESPARPRAGVVVLHGYAEVPTLAESIDRRAELVERGTAVLAVRMRGYPGSRAGVGDITAEPYGWICHGLASVPDDPRKPTDWVLSDAVADTLYAIAALRRRLPRGAPVFVLGQSFGGGIAVIAAGQAAALAASHPEVRIDRLAVGVPTFGDWPWRLEHTHARSPGSGGEVQRFLMANHGDDAGIRRALALFDATIHAKLVRCPTICKLAMRDDVVPAPTQHAVFNALGCAPGEKTRFLTPFGHFEGGIADTRRHAMYDRFVADFLDASNDPMSVMAAWESVCVEGQRPPATMRGDDT
ncbi:MAG: acetylxylan esterase [Planctomycetota bacterium]